MTDIFVMAKELLENRKVNLIIGYEKGSAGNPRPAFITSPEKTDKLIWNESCVQNLAVYLTKPEVKAMGKMGIFANLPVMRSIMMLISEQQVKPEDVVILGISPDGKLLDMPDVNIMQDYIEKCDLNNPDKDREMIEELKKMTPAQRFRFWEETLSACIKCYACRQACPMCYCTRCTVEVNQPQWVPVQSSTQGNVEWHILRAMHLSGRCIGCGECGRACPVGIPCHLLTMYMSEKVHEHFNVFAGTSDKMKSVMSTFEPGDKESFII